MIRDRPAPGRRITRSRGSRTGRRARNGNRRAQGPRRSPCWRARSPRNTTSDARCFARIGPALAESPIYRCQVLLISSHEEVRPRMRTVTQWLVVGALTAALAGRAIAAGVFVYPQRGLQGVTNTWDDVQGAFDYWSE